MGATCSRASVIEFIPDKSVMLEIVDKVLEFESILKRGEHLTRTQEKEKKGLDSIARAMKKVGPTKVSKT